MFRKRNLMKRLNNFCRKNQHQCDRECHGCGYCPDVWKMEDEYQKERGKNK